MLKFKTVPPVRGDFPCVHPEVIMGLFPSQQVRWVNPGLLEQILDFGRDKPCLGAGLVPISSNPERKSPAQPCTLGLEELLVPSRAQECTG